LVPECESAGHDLDAVALGTVIVAPRVRRHNVEVMGFDVAAAHAITGEDLHEAAYAQIARLEAAETLDGNVVEEGATVWIGPQSEAFEAIVGGKLDSVRPGGEAYECAVGAPQRLPRREAERRGVRQVSHDNDLAD
jgi:hypothetical protein